MKRGKFKPPSFIVDEATIFADIIAVGRREEIEDKIDPLVKIAMAEYMRVYKARKMNDDPWVEMPLYEDEPNRRSGSGYPKGGVVVFDNHTGPYRYASETDFQCFFCRKSLNTLARFRVASRDFRKKLRTDHIDECAIRFLAGIGDPHPPLPEGTPGR